MFKKLLIFVLFIIAAIAGYFAYQWYYTNDNFMRQIYLVPANAVYVLQTNEPVKNWNKFSSSDLWKYFKQHPKFSDIARSADAIDKFFKDNEGLLGNVGSRDFTLSAHVTKYNDYDFLFIIDLSKASKISILKSNVENVFSKLGYKVTVRNYKDQTIYEMLDPATHETLYMCIVSNQAVCSYYGSLIERSIDEKENPTIAKQNKFIELEEKTGEKGMARLFINYKYSKEFLNCYLSNMNGVASDMGADLEFSGLTLGMDDGDIDISYQKI